MYPGLSHSAREAGKNKTPLDGGTSQIWGRRLLLLRWWSAISSTQIPWYPYSHRTSLLTRKFESSFALLFHTTQRMRPWISRSNLAEIKGTGESKLRRMDIPYFHAQKKSKFSCGMERLIQRWYPCLIRPDQNFWWPGCLRLKWSWMSSGVLCLVDFHGLLANHKVWHIMWIGCVLCLHGIFRWKLTELAS